MAPVTRDRRESNASEDLAMEFAERAARESIIAREQAEMRRVERERMRAERGEGAANGRDLIL